MNSLLRKTAASMLLAIAAQTAWAQQALLSRELVRPSVDFFVPHWQLGLQAGGACDVGEAKFKNLVSPALQATIGYQFNEYLGARFGLSGLWARNRYAYPEVKYKWNFIQPAVDVKVDLTSLVMGWVYDQPVSAYAFLGVGAAYAFNNDDAVDAHYNVYGVSYRKLWEKQRWNPVLRGGLGAEVRVTDEVAVTVEGNANMLPDHFNSKKGLNDNRDWHFNALVGVKINLTRSHGTIDAQFRETIQQIPQPKPKRQDYQAGDTIALTEYVLFKINTSNIRPSEEPKIERVLRYLREHPGARVELTGFADKETGTPTINDRLSRERATNVTQYLVDRGIERRRIGKYAKGDRVQPFDQPEDNRVTICFVIDNTIIPVDSRK